METQDAIQYGCDDKIEEVNQKINEAVDSVVKLEQYIRNKVKKSITEKPKRKPKGYTTSPQNIEDNEKGGM